MAITLTGTGGLFTRLGHMIFALNSLNTYLGNSTISAGCNSVGKSVLDINNQFLSADEGTIDTIYQSLATMRGSQQTWEGVMQNLAQQTLINMANDDTPLPSQDLATALKLLISQMGSATASVNQPTTSASAAVAGHADGTANTGTGVVAVSVKSVTGKTLDYIFNETLTITCTQDAQSGATKNQEQFTITSPVAATDVMGYNFPLGSGVNATVNVVDPTQNNSAGNLLYNSDFETDVSVANVPDSWTAVAATPGTDLLVTSGSGGVFGKGYMKFVANSGSTPGVTELFGAASSATGTPATLSPDTQYAVSLWAEKSTGLSGAGTLAVSLVDGSGTVINDDAGTANTITQSIAGCSSTTFTNIKGFFRTPAILPATQKIKVYTSVAIADAAQYVIVGGLAMALSSQSPNQVYSSGPNVVLFAGPTQFYLNDRFTVAINNNYAGLFQVGLDKFYSLRANGFQIPSSGSPTINDNLVA